MKKITKIALLTGVLLSPLAANSQINGGAGGSTFHSIVGDNYSIDAFVRVKRDYSNATYQGFGMWSGNVDEVIAIGSRIRRTDNTTSIQNLIREWKNLSNQSRLAELQGEINQFTAAQDCNELLGLADLFRDVLDELGDKLGTVKKEFGAIIVFDNGDTSFYESHIYTDNSSTSIGHPVPPNTSSIVSVVHNHPPQGSRDIRLENRYPSEVDWDAADALVDNGADPNILSLTILDSFGEVRVFKYSEKSIFKDLESEDRVKGTNLPPAVPEEASLGECVKI